MDPFSKTAVPAWTRAGYVPGLDGMRGLAIMAVILKHLGDHIGLPAWVQHVPGVNMFFVISGFLITLLMLRERETTGATSTWAFYGRRALRIMPAYFVYLAVIGLACLLGWTTIDGRIWIGALTYTTCYVPFFSQGWELGHSWSLSVQEHFYVLWPLVFNRVRPARLGSVVLGWLLLTPLIRYGVWSLHHPNLDIDFASITRMSGIGVGCLLALLVTRKAYPTFLDGIIRHPGRFIIGGVALTASVPVLCLSGKLTILFSGPFASWGCAAILAGIMFSRSALLAKIINARSLIWVGQLSYSLYLWQQPFTSSGFGSHMFPHWTLNLVAIFVCGWLSYTFVEMPVVRWRKRKPLTPLAVPPFQSTREAEQPI